MNYKIIIILSILLLIICIGLLVFALKTERAEQVQEQINIENNTEEEIIPLTVNEIIQKYYDYDYHQILVKGKIVSRGGDRLTIVDTEPDSTDEIKVWIDSVKSYENPGYLDVGDIIKVQGVFDVRQTGGTGYHKTYEFRLHAQKIEKVE